MWSSVSADCLHNVYRNTIAKEEEASKVRDEKRESVTEKLETKLMLNSFR